MAITSESAWETGFRVAVIAAVVAVIVVVAAASVAILVVFGVVIDDICLFLHFINVLVCSYHLIQVSLISNL